MDFPTAFYLSPLQDVIDNPNLLFRLVTPVPPNRLIKEGGVQSAAGLVNVIPKKRIYLMENVDEIEIFRQELLSRPLVIQCTSHSGLGFGSAECGCGSFSQERHFVLLINQTHPKVLGRLQMGIEAAKHAMRKGMPFVLRYRFGSLLERFHDELSIEEVSGSLHYKEWESAELVVRFPGRHSITYISPSATFKAPTCSQLEFDFADIHFSEIKTVYNDSELVLKGALPAITADEIRDELPGWTVNEITPLEEFGEERPSTYSYAQAGRLYESFRRKKRPKKPRQEEEDASEMGGVFPDKPRIDFTNMKTETSFINDGRVGGSVQQPLQYRPQRSNDKYSPEAGYVETNLYPAVNLGDKPHGHSTSGETVDYYNISSPGARIATPFDQVHHRDSDRSTHSTGESSGAGADSGYSGDDGYNGYHGYGRRNERGDRGHARKGLHDHDEYIEDKYGGTTGQIAHDNYAFHHEEAEDNDSAIQKHKAFVSKMLKSPASGGRSPASGGRSPASGGRSPGYDSRYSPSGYASKDGGRSPSGQLSSGDHYEHGKQYSPSGRDYSDRSRSRGYSDPDDGPPSYGEVLTTGQGVLNFTQQEQVAESFI